MDSADIEPAEPRSAAAEITCVCCPSGLAVTCAGGLPEEVPITTLAANTTLSHARSDLGGACQDRFRFFLRGSPMWLSSAPVRRRTLRSNKNAAQDLWGSWPLPRPFFPRCPSVRCAIHSSQEQLNRSQESFEYVVKRRPTTFHGLALVAPHFLPRTFQLSLIFSREFLPSGLLVIVQLRAFASGPCVGSTFVVGTDCCGLADLWFILCGILGLLVYWSFVAESWGCASRVDSFWASFARDSCFDLWCICLFL